MDYEGFFSDIRTVPQGNADAPRHIDIRNSRSSQRGRNEDETKGFNWLRVPPTDDGGSHCFGARCICPIARRLHLSNLREVDTVEVTFDVDVEHPVIPPAALTSLAYGIDRRPAGPVAIRVGVEHRL